MRASWHAESRSIVLSHWSDDVCTASSRVALAAAPRLIGFIVDSLHHAATVPVPGAAAAPAPGSRSPVLRFVEETRAWLRRRMAPAAPVISLPEHNRRSAPDKADLTPPGVPAQACAPWSGHKSAR